MFKTFEKLSMTNFWNFDRCFNQKRPIFTPMTLKLYLASGFFLLSAVSLSQSRGYIENKGQWHDEIVARYPLVNGSAWFFRDRVRIALIEETTFHEASEIAHHHPEQDSWADGHTYEMIFGAASIPSFELGKRHRDYVNYFIGNRPEKWASRVGVYDELKYTEVQRGVNMHWEMDDGRLKYTILVAKDVNPNEVYIEYQAIRALETKDGKLLITLPNMVIEEQTPYAFQLIDGREVEVACEFKLMGNRVYYELGAYRNDQTLYIDPVIVASTNSGSTHNTWGHSATYDQFGNIVGGGRPFGQGFPTDTGSFQMNFAGGGVDIGVCKLNEDGSDLIWSTYIGGATSDEYVHSLVVNAFNQVVVYGKVNSTDYPVTNSAFDTTHNGTTDICLSIISDSGDALIGSTYVGGEGDDGNNQIFGFSYNAFKGEVVTDAYNNVYVASTSTSDTFPTTPGAYQSANAGNQDGVVFKMNYNLSEMIFSTYLGDTLNDGVFNIKPAEDNSVYVVGITANEHFPTTAGAQDETWNYGQTDAFISRLSANGTTLLQSTFVQADSGSSDYGLFLQVDRYNDVYILGKSDGITADTNKYSGPTTNQSSFIRKYSAELDTLYWTSTFASLGHSAFLVDNCRNIYVGGNEASANGDYELTANAVQPTPGAFYIMVLSPEADSLIHGTYFGSTGSHVDGGTSRFDKRGVVYQATCTAGAFPLTNNAWSGNQSNSYDLTLFKIDFEVQATVANAQVAPNAYGCVPFTVDFTNYGSEGISHFWDFGDGDTSNLQTPTHTFSTPGEYEVKYVIFDTVGCVLSDTATLYIYVLDTASISIYGDTGLCAEKTVLSTNSPFSNYQWSTGATSQSIEVTAEGSYWIEVTNVCGTFTDTFDVTIIPPYEFSLPDDTTMCEPGLLIKAPEDAVNFLWSTGSVNDSIFADSTGMYWLAASNAFCSDTDTVHIALAYVNFNNSDTVVCEDSIVISVQSAAGNIAWSTGDTTASIVVNQSGQYWSVVQAGFCSSTDTIHVTLVPTVLEVGPDTVICGPTEFSAFHPTLDHYEWSTGDTSSAVTIDSTMTLWVIGSNAFCADSDTIVIRRERFEFLTTEEIVCDKDSHYLTGPGLPEYKYHWNNGDTTFQTTVYGSGVYHVTVSTDYCTATDTLRVSFNRAPRFSLGEDVVICRGEPIMLFVDSLQGPVQWSTGDTGRVITVRDTGIYMAAMIADGCEATDTLHVQSRILIPDSVFLVPNVITPNGDGLNDVLGLDIVDPNLVTDYSLLVYNRWGTLIFESKYINHDWDGRMPDGKDAEEGVYFYLFNGKTVCTDLPIIEVKDHVTLMR